MKVLIPFFVILGLLIFFFKHKPQVVNMDTQKSLAEAALGASGEYDHIPDYLPEDIAHSNLEVSISNDEIAKAAQQLASNGG